MLRSGSISESGFSRLLMFPSLKSCLSFHPVNPDSDIIHTSMLPPDFLLLLSSFANHCLNQDGQDFQIFRIGVLVF